MSDAFWNGLFIFLGVLTSAIPGLIAAVYAKRSIVVTQEGNQVAAKAVDAAQAAQAEAKRSRAELGAQIKDHSDTTTLLIAKGIERTQFEKAMAIGEKKARTGGRDDA